MSHYDVDYKDLTPLEARTKAIEDIKDYMGTEKFEAITKDFRAYPPMTISGLSIYLSICGVQGFPVEAWHDVIWPYG